VTVVAAFILVAATFLLLFGEQVSNSIRTAKEKP
jgi:hypothetical protein